MVRLGSVALIALSLSAAAWSNPLATAESSERPQSFHLPPTSDHHRFAPGGSVGRAEIAPNTHFGLGMFGLKTEKSYLRPATGREIDTRKQRRAGVGFSLKF